MLALLLVAASLGLSNFGAAIGLGMTGVDAGVRARVGLVFGVFEAGMPILGLALGHGIARALGHATHWLAAGLLIATGCYMALQSRGGPGGARAGRRCAARRTERGDPAPRTGRVLVTGLAVSADNLVAGFALGTYHAGIAVAALTIGAVSVALSMLGLELGDRAGAKIAHRGELLGGLVLGGVGVAIAAGVL
jgi:putative Mn2+ efflux pump MntP